MFDRRLVSNFDWSLLLSSLLVSALGIVNLYSTGSISSGPGITPLYLKQFYWLLVGLFLFFTIVTIDYQFVARYAYLLHGLSLLLLLIALLWAKPTAGTHRWLQIGGLSFQPSEFAKITLVLLLSRSFSGVSMSDAEQFRGIALPSFFTALTFLLVFLEPDLGTAALFVLVFFSFFFLIKLDLKNIFLFISSGAVLLPCAWFFLEDYQKGRLISFFNPGKDSLRAGYQAIQSKIAIGSGMLFGKGFGIGTQSQLRFLPEQHTDFAFSVWAEEWGFFGALMLVLVLFFILSKGLKIAAQSRDRLGSFVSVALVLILFWQVVINISMVSGLFPTVGIPLPFVSYGGSSLVSTWIIIGILQNIRMRKLVF